MPHLIFSQKKMNVFLLLRIILIVTFVGKRGYNEAKLLIKNTQTDFFPVDTCLAFVNAIDHHCPSISW